MGVYQSLPWIAALAFLLALILIATRDAERPMRNGWTVAAAASALFLAWSVYAVAMGGPLGFWSEHTRNAWGNQIWFDLLLGVTAALALLVPQAKRAGMHPLPWLLLIACTGNVGLMAMLSRLLYLRERNAIRPAGA